MKTYYGFRMPDGGWLGSDTGVFKSEDKDAAVKMAPFFEERFKCRVSVEAIPDSELHKFTQHGEYTGTLTPEGYRRAASRSFPTSPEAAST